METDTAEGTGLAFLDENGDGIVSVRDLWELFVDLVFYPGDAFVLLLSEHAPALAQFLELGPDDVGTPAARFIAAGVWIAVFIIAGTVISFVSNVDRMLTAWIAARFRDILRLGRILRRRVALAFVALIPRKRQPATETEEISLGKVETTVLRCYAGRDDVESLSAEDIARTTNLTKQQVAAAQRRLLELQLIKPMHSGRRRHVVHQISEAGQMYLIGV